MVERRWWCDRGATMVMRWWCDGERTVAKFLGVEIVLGELLCAQPDLAESSSGEAARLEHTRRHADAAQVAGGERRKRGRIRGCASFLGQQVALLSLMWRCRLEREHRKACSARKERGRERCVQLCVRLVSPCAEAAQPHLRWCEACCLQFGRFEPRRAQPVAGEATLPKLGEHEA